MCFDRLSTNGGKVKSSRPNKYPARYAEQKREIQLIKIAQKQLGMDDDAYRDILFTLTRKRSSTELDFAERKKVLEHFEACGFKRTPKQPRKLADDPQSKLIRSLWLQLHEAGKVRNPSESALAAFVKRQVGRDDLHWLNAREASSVIEDLKKWLAR
ncbi:MAG TPA: regulatory protein GemA [Gallionellaceae bacterium]|nr:regulatory protein GemA [Gallionellaceae bacterium]